MSNQSSLNLETEVKFYVSDFTAVREQLQSVGAVLTKPRVYERNWVFDTEDAALFARGQLLRLRQDTAVILTFKGTVPEDLLSEAKVREELEVTVDDFDTAVSILSRLGFQPHKVYEKYRETFNLDKVKVTLDEMPFGNFLELEGAEEAIKSASRALGLDWNQRLVTNYLALMDQFKAHYSLPFDDITFENFQGLSVSALDLLP